MILGKIALASAFLLFLGSSFYFVFSEIKSESLYARRARAFFILGASVILFLIILLFYFIFTHQFQYTFVYQYSSADLPGYYLFSTLWAGQAGTFFMWALFTAAYGFIIMLTPGKYNLIVLGILSSVIAFLVILAMKVNPFEYIWVTNPGSFSPGQIPIDGRGLNPLLQDYWMVIHPPILFIGYSSTVMPFAFVIARLFKGNDKEFVTFVQPWALFNLLILGIGIILGGYWAYTTLGWGGYWGWDPVENSSLIPWLFTLAYVHGLIIEKRKQALIKTNLLIGGMPFIAMLYGSFLTRSGILADFSVHSFIDQGINVILLSFLLLFLLLFIVSLLIKLRSFQSQPMQNSLYLQENFIGYGILITTIFAILVFIGTSSPLLTSLLSNKAANVSIEYYYLVGTTISILMLFLIALTPYLPWKEKTLESEKTLFAVVLVISIIIALILYFYGLTKPISIVLIAASLFALILNANLLYKRAKNKFWLTGSFLAHSGISLMVIGIVASSMYGESLRIAVPEKGVEKALGFTFEFKGIKSGDRGQDYAQILVTKGKDSFWAEPHFYFSDYTRSYMTTPYVKNYLDHDLYIAPIQILDSDEVPKGKRVELNQNSPVFIDSVRVLLTKLSMERIEMHSKIKAVAHILIFQGRDSTVLRPAIIVNKNDRELESAQWVEKNIELSLAGINVEERAATIYYNNKLNTARPAKYIVLEISEKPFISILWVGTIILIFGISISLRQKKRLLSLR